MPKISVIMGVYNSKNTELLKESIKSILNQSFNDFEFIICNDCSTKTEISEILSEFSYIDDRIIILNNEKNSGLAQSLNNCLKIACGEFIARQDDDDISLPNRFKTQIAFLESHSDCALVGCNTFLFDDDGVWGLRNYKEYPVNKDFLFGTQFSHPTMMIRSNVIKEIGCYTSSKLTRRTEDYDLFMRLYYFGYYGVNLQIPLYKYYESDLTYKQQKLRYRIDEARLKNYWFKKFKFYPKGLIYLLKPIISGLTPLCIRRRRKKKIYSKMLKDFELENKL